MCIRDRGETVVLFEFHDPIEQAYDDAVLERLNTDELTGLLARRKFEMELRSAISAALRGDEQVVLLMVDIDNLKPVNDAHGHLAGAQVIARVGELLEEVFGQSSFACRLGGDEFAVTRRGGVAEALELAESLLALVRRDPFEIDGRSFAIRVSVGIAVLPDDAGAVGELFRRADKALYEAKAFGGDRARRWNAP